MDYSNLQEKLEAPFAYEEIEWRINKVYRSRKATVLAYMTSRAVMKRFDEVFGIDGWSDSYQHVEGGIVCSISCRFFDESGDAFWVKRSDGAPPTNYEAFKGGISDAFKRAAVKWGIGRYLYGLDETWTTINEKEGRGHPNAHFTSYSGKDKGGEFRVSGYWLSPMLPAWALPAGSKNPVQSAPVQKDEMIEPVDGKAPTAAEMGGSDNNDFFVSAKIRYALPYKKEGHDMAAIRSAIKSSGFRFDPESKNWYGNDVVEAAEAFRKPVSDDIQEQAAAEGIVDLTAPEDDDGFEDDELMF